MPGARPGLSFWMKARMDPGIVASCPGPMLAGRKMGSDVTGVNQGVSRISRAIGLLLLGDGISPVLNVSLH
jgi:hypothetical protein